MNGTKDILDLIKNHSNAKALSAFEQLGIPTKKDESYIYTDLQERMPINNIHSNTSSQKNEASDSDILIVDGEIMSKTDNNQRYTISEESTASDTSYVDGMVALNAALAPKHIRIKIDKESLEPIVITMNSTAEEGVLASQLCTIDIAANCNAKILLNQIFDRPSTINAVTYVNVGEYAKVEIVTLQNYNSKASVVNGLYISQLANSEFRSNTINLGSVLTRNNLRTTFKGEHSEAKLYGLYLTDGDQHTDNFTSILHNVPNCKCHELYKGIMSGCSTAAFTGSIKVMQDAQKTEALQTDRNLLLSEQARAFSKPQLEIYADDVKCSHGATVGRLNAEHLFYMQARGIGAKEAKRLLVGAFANEVVEKIENDSLKQRVTELVDNKMVSLID